MIDMLMRYKLMSLIASFVIFPVLFTLISWSASATETGCTEQFFQGGYFMEDDNRVFDDQIYRVFSMEVDTKVYLNSTGNALSGNTLNFDEKFLVSDPGEGTNRIRLRSFSDEEVGWVDRDTVLCRIFPLKDKLSGLLRRVVIRTETAVQGQVQPKIAYHSPDGKCEGGPAGCVKVSRFQWYFVYAERNSRYLLSEAANLGATDARLLGWLPKNDGISWNTAIALRPSEELAKRKGKQGSKEDFICAYTSLADVKQKRGCRQILGGRRWYNLEVRLPIIREHGDVYQVAVSSAASVGSIQETLAYASLNKLKNVDVFFVIDGTKSMKPVIDAIKGTRGRAGLVDRIRTQLKNKQRKGGSIRFGYRVYRDSEKGGKSGVTDDGLPLSNDCRSNEQAFINSFAAVQATPSPNDNDFPENLFGGLVRAARDIASCPDHLKIIFVIGDHGYDAAAQQQRGHSSYNVNAIINRLKQGKRINTLPVVVFIQTPSTVDQVDNKEMYRTSYEKFREQGIRILRGVYSQIEQNIAGTIVNPGDYYHRLPAGDLDQAVVDRIVEPVNNFLQPDIPSRLTTRLRAGESLVEAIQAMRAGSSSNIPILYWNVVAQSLCKRIGKQCNQKVFEGVFEAYIPRSKDIVHEVILSQRQLTNWRGLLGKFKTFWSALRTDRQTRKELVNVLLESIGTVLKLEIDDSGRSMGEFVQFKGGLPYGAKSKLMNYSPGELRNDKIVPRCEIRHLVNYARKKADILRIVEDGDKLALFTEKRLPVGACSGLTAKGLAVPFLPKSPTPMALNRPDEDTEYSFRFQKGNDRYYWIPVSYLP